MLSHAVARVAAAGWRVGNVDVTVVAERPKIGPHRDAMRAVLARTLQVDVSAVSVKGKTNERMGWIGREEGLGCVVVACLVARSGR
jgi:2-C-methyl-D-erythritol 2,4-cyclodiphosphate synthase